MLFYTTSDNRVFKSSLDGNKITELKLRVRGKTLALAIAINMICLAQKGISM